VTDPVAEAARSAAAILTPEFGPGLPAEVEAALHTRQADGQRPGRYDPAALASLGVSAASLIVTIAQLAWSIVSDQRSHMAQPSPEAIARQIHIHMRQHDIPAPPGTDHITDVVITEITPPARPTPLDTRSETQKRGPARLPLGPRNACG
jgi:hypothetical protein